MVVDAIGKLYSGPGDDVVCVCAASPVHERLKGDDGTSLVYVHRREPGFSDGYYDVIRIWQL